MASREPSTGGPVDRLLHRVQAAVGRVVERVGNVPAVQAAGEVFGIYDAAGGGLVAGGLAYAALVALLPGLLLIVSAVGFLVHDPAIRAGIVESISSAVPPIEDIVRSAFEQVSAGAVPTGVIGIVGLLWGASRFYAAIDNSFSRIFRGSQSRNEIVRTARGLLLTAIIVAMPLAALLLGSIAGWVLDLAPLTDVGGFARTAWQLATPLVSFVLFMAGTIVVYRFVPNVPVPMRALLPPALLVGLVLALFAQLFTFIGPRLAGAAVIYGTFVAIFALLAWLSISFNLLLLGAAWTRVRVLALAELEEGPIDTTASSGSEANPSHGPSELPAQTGSEPDR